MTGALIAVLGSLLTPVVLLFIGAVVATLGAAAGPDTRHVDMTSGHV
jgi:4-hydroxybenzoate polyprenyltransferase